MEVRSFAKSIIAGGLAFLFCSIFVAVASVRLHKPEDITTTENTKWTTVAKPITVTTQVYVRLTTFTEADEVPTTTATTEKPATSKKSTTSPQSRKTTTETTEPTTESTTEEPSTDLYIEEPIETRPVTSTEATGF